MKNTILLNSVNIVKECPSTYVIWREKFDGLLINSAELFSKVLSGHSEMKYRKITTYYKKVLYIYFFICFWFFLNFLRKKKKLGFEFFSEKTKCEGKSRNKLGLGFFSENIIQFKGEKYLKIYHFFC